VGSGQICLKTEVSASPTKSDVIVGITTDVESPRVSEYLLVSIAGSVAHDDMITVCNWLRPMVMF
jgi:hypothetical protein